MYIYIYTDTIKYMHNDCRYVAWWFGIFVIVHPIGDDPQ